MTRQLYYIEEDFPGKQTRPVQWFHSTHYYDVLEELDAVKAELKEQGYIVNDITRYAFTSYAPGRASNMIRYQMKNIHFED